MRRAALALALLAASVFAPGAAAQESDAGCLHCHGGIEDMHPWKPLGCTECHGGRGDVATLDGAHVKPRVPFPRDERVVHTGFEPEALRFRNPTDLRVVDTTCGRCHARFVEHVERSLHGTTAGHLNDGLYENGVNPSRRAVYGVFDVRDPRDADERPEGALAGLVGIERLRPAARDEGLGAHFADLPRKACMQCHPWSSGFAVRGRLGQDGLYRGAGCASCHVTYASDGLSRSADASIDHAEPGHPLTHAMTGAPPTQTCTACHVGDASIGNAFQGLAQLYPSMPAGPDVPGTTDSLRAGQFFLRDGRLLPPDVHHAAGMHCVDCHTAADVMGDGALYGAMDRAVEIECTSCHGTPDAYADLTTERGRRLTNVERKGDLFVLASKVTGRVLRVKQAKDVVDPDHPDYNERAALAMTSRHASLECYACHSGWNTNFFGFHFDRNEQFTQLDLVKGQRTQGLVSTQERVFATLRQLVLGYDPDGRIAPYMVGFSSMGTVHAEDGSLAIDQGLPETAAGLSGMTMIHHQTHAVQPAARSCVECHRSPATWGLGTGGDAGGSYALARGLLVAVGERGVETMLYDRTNPEQSLHLARLPLGGARKVVLDSDSVSGRASTAFVAVEHAGVALVDVRNPAFPEVSAFVAAGDVRDLQLCGDLLLVANGVGGLRVVDVSERRQPRLVSDVITEEARGLDVRWPYAYVADGPGGLAVVDLSVPSRPRIAGQAPCRRDATELDDARAVALVFQYGRPDGPRARTPARMLAVVANGRFGAAFLDVTEPTDVRLLRTTEDREVGVEAVDVAITARFELGDTTGVRPTVERDQAYVATNVAGLRGDVLVFDVTDPVDGLRLVSDARFPREDLLSAVTVVKSFDPPLLSTRLLVAGVLGLSIVEATDSDAPTRLFTELALSPLSDVAAEAFAFDRMLDETGTQKKDISHEGGRFLRPEEIHRVLTVPPEALGLFDDGGARREDLREAFARRARPGGVAEFGRPPEGQPDLSQEERLERLRRGFRLGPAEPLARMVRPLDPLASDANDDRALSRGELERAFFALLDANGDGRLDPLEWPRHPHADPGALDRNRDGVVERNEMDLDGDVFAFFDVDGDGLVRLDEWPFERVGETLPTLMYASLDGLRRTLGSQGFAERRPTLQRLLAGGPSVKPHDVDDLRLQQRIDQARARALVDVAGEPAPGGFVERFDLDGDGAVEPFEHVRFARAAERCDLDGDGRIDARDRPGARGGRR